ncbi:MAG: TIGR03435 family protein [Candidatus Acidiferrum sp.]
MIPNSLTQSWTALAPALGNHLWQSTIFAAAAAALTLAFRRNRASTRYWLWLAASLKFLVPFSLLVSVGSYLAIPHKPVATNAALYSAIEQFGQPFDAQNAASFAHAAPATTAINPAAHYLPLILIVWLLGSLAVLFVWLARWYRVSNIAKNATPLDEGPESKIVAELQQNVAAREKIAIVSTAESIEPGIFGILRPLLLWPASISGQLTEAHTESIVAHELCHVRRRDNLTAALHMLVESLFWFHPVVWWLGNRLVEDRERACDEAVVDSGREPHVYAESILKVCEFCVESPLPCVPGVSGADLKRRIASIMSDRPARALSLSRKLLLVAATILAIAAPILAGAFQNQTSPKLRAAQLLASVSTSPTYSSVSITPNISGGDGVTLMFGSDQFVSKNATLQQVIRTAYGMEDDRIVNAPAWLTTDKYDFVATGTGGTSSKGLEESGREQRVMLQSALADRLKLTVHLEMKDIRVYALVIAKSGPKLKESKRDNSGASTPSTAESAATRRGIHIDGNATMVARGIPIEPLVFHLSKQLHRTVLNETGLSGNYDFTLNFPDGIPVGIDNPTPAGSYEPALSSALEDQLGLVLEPRETKMEVLVIDHVEKPSASQSQTTAPATLPPYEAASIKLDQDGTDSLRTGTGIIRQRMQLNPGEFHGTNNSLREMIRVAYGIKDYQIFGAPDWLSTDLYDVDAKSKEAAINALKNLPEDKREAASRVMLQQLLAERFQLQSHFESKQLPAYSLVVLDPNKLHAASGSCDPPLAGPQTFSTDAPPCGELTTLGPGRLAGTKAPIEHLVRYLSEITGRSVQNKTNLAARYDIDLTWEPPYRVDKMPPPDHTEPANPSLLAAIQTQLGLKLQPETSAVNLLVIDHVERPSETTARLQ